jgi:hypothetical protein
VKRLLLLLTASMLLATHGPARATNYPCSQSKGGTERCEGTKFICRDGSVSASKKKCTPQKVADFRRQWERDNGQRSNQQEESEE